MCIWILCQWISIINLTTLKLNQHSLCHILSLSSYKRCDFFFQILNSFTIVCLLLPASSSSWSFNCTWSVCLRVFKIFIHFIGTLCNSSIYMCMYLQLYFTIYKADPSQKFYFGKGSSHQYFPFFSLFSICQCLPFSSCQKGKRKKK